MSTVFIISLRLKRNVQNTLVWMMCVMQQKYFMMFQNQILVQVHSVHDCVVPFSVGVCACDYVSCISVTSVRGGSFALRGGR